MNTSAEPIRVLELRSVKGTGGGPDKTILNGTARTDTRRFEICVCYVRDIRDTSFSIHESAASLGIDYVEALERHSFDTSVWHQLSRIVRDRRIDIVHAHDYKTDFLAWLLSLRTPVIPLSTAHGWSGDSFRERLYYAFDKRLLARFPAVIAVSGPIERTLIDHGATSDKVHRIPNGIDQQFFRRIPDLRERMRRALSIPSTELVIGSVGRLEPEKRFDLLLKAAAQISPVPRIVLIGEGSYRDALLRQASALGIAGQLTLAGLRRDVRDVLSAFDVFVQCSDTEGVPNAVLEAMATEVPVVATDVGGTSEVVEHGVDGLLVRRRDVEGLTHAIERTLCFQSETACRVRQARSRIERELSFDARMAKVEKIYLTLFNGRHHFNQTRAS
jgi:glycosyltransferase involved in cell wall biosynthesis